MSRELPDERARFEKSMRAIGWSDYDLTWDEDDYGTFDSRLAWKVWQEAVRLEREALLPDALRYRHVRTLSVRAFGDLSTRNFEGEGAFDDLVDQDIEMREEAIDRAKEPSEKEPPK